jgi:hypothetical protein
MKRINRGLAVFLFFDTLLVAALIWAVLHKG